MKTNNLSVPTSSRDYNFVHVNLSKFGTFDTIVPAKIDLTRAVPIIDKPDDYKCSVTAFSLKSSLIPTFQDPPTGFESLYRTAIVAIDYGKLKSGLPYACTPYTYPLTNVESVMNIWPNAPRDFYLSEQAYPKSNRGLRNPAFSYEKIISDINDCLFSCLYKYDEYAAATYQPSGNPAAPGKVPPFFPSGNKDIDCPWFSLKGASTQVNFTTYWVPELFEYKSFPASPTPTRGGALYLCLSKAVAQKFTFPFFGIDNFDIQPGENLTGIDSEFTTGKDSDLVFLDLSSIWRADSSQIINTYSKWICRNEFDVSNTIYGFQPVKVDYIQAEETTSNLQLWNYPQRIFFRSNLPLHNQIIGGQQSAVVDNILQDYEITDLISGSTSTVNIIVPTSVYFSIKQGSNLSKLYIEVYWVDFLGEAHPVYLSGNDSFNITIGFERLIPRYS